MKLHDVKAAAEILGISPWTVRARIRSGQIQPVRIGRLVRIEEEELGRFIERRKTRTAEVCEPKVDVPLNSDSKRRSD